MSSEKKEEETVPQSQDRHHYQDSYMINFSTSFLNASFGPRKRYKCSVVCTSPGKLGGKSKYNIKLTSVSKSDDFGIMWVINRKNFITCKR